MTSKEALERLYNHLKAILEEDAPELIRIIKSYYDIVGKDLEVLDIIKKYHLIGNIAVQKVDVADINETHIKYKLRCSLMTEFVLEEEYKVLKEWLENGD